MDWIHLAGHVEAKSDDVGVNHAQIERSEEEVRVGQSDEL